MNITEKVESNNNIISWTKDAKNALGFYRALGRILGIWPLDQQTMFSYIRVAFIIIAELSMSLSLIVLLITKGNCGTTMDFVDVLTLIICGFPTVLKVLIPKIYYHKMYSIVNTAVEDWRRVNDRKLHRIMSKYANLGKLMFITMMTGAYSVGSPLIIYHLPFFMKLRNHHEDHNTSMNNIPIGPSCWISPDSSTVYYVTFFIVQSIQILTTCTAYVGSDTYFFGIAMHVCGQFELLYVKFKHFNKVNDKKIQQRFSCLVKRHQLLLELVNNFENVYTIIILGQVLGTVFSSCITSISLLMSLQSGDKVVIMQLTTRICIAYTQLMIYCYVGEQLTNKIQKLQIAIYSSDWYTMSYKTVKDIELVMMKTNVPFYLTAGKMYNMSHENFKNILRTTGSFFSVLRLMLLSGTSEK